MRNSWGFELDTPVVRLMYRDDHAWTEVAEERIEGANSAERLKAMVALIENDAATDLFLPRSQIVYADVQIDPDRATRQELERALSEHMPDQVGKLDLDWEVTVHGTVRVAAISLETLKEALDLASALGIRVGRLSTLADPADFPRSPNFCGRGADVPLSTMIDNASDGRARKTPGAGIGNRLMPLLGAVGHRIPQRQRTRAMFAVTLAAALGIAALLWTTLPGFRTPDQTLDERPESGLASGAPLAEPELAAPAPEGVDTANDPLRQRPPVVHSDARQLADPWRRNELRAPALGAGVTPTPLTGALALTQPHLPPLRQVEHAAPERADTAKGLLLKQPPVVHADARQLSDLWRRSEPQAPDDDTGIAVAPLSPALALAHPNFPHSPQAGHEAPERVDTANGLLLQQPPVVHADARQLSRPWRRGEPQAPDDDTGIAVAPLPPALALAHPNFPHSPQAVHDAPAHADTAHGLLLQRPPVAHADARQLPGPWRRGEPQDPNHDGINIAPLTTTLALTRPHLVPAPQSGRTAALLLDAPLPMDHDPLAPAFADRLTPHDDPPSGTKPAIDRPAYALRDTGDFPDGAVGAAPAPHTTASHSPVPPELLPRVRPDGFAEYVERLKFGGRTLAELATLRAVPRPASAQQLAASSAEPSVATIGSGSAAPGMRPDNFDAVVAAVDAQRRLAAAARAQRALDAARNAQSALVADAEPELSQEDLANRGTPSRSTVATRATIPNAIRLNEVNLVGVYGTTGDRRALVRLPSGRYVRVRVGDRVDGGRVARITESELFYQKGNRTVSLRVPRG